ncbi:hypothetical protein DU490_05280 [Halomonas sp. DQ26W]|uniref:hypothetical protein n=1 Tax=Halomonas sp. DQ26W TaxID=2282311 RepID=UPI000DF7C129|nr:hypothetical protein [Halomonas sp. DQ26W]RDB43825.1 hypothetical protein DU490_05280 [Halomonas sp. DQ26W]
MAVLAIAVSLAIFVVGWLSLGMVLFLIGMLGDNARDGSSFLFLMNFLFLRFASVAFGAYLATHITPILFKKVNPITIRNGFITIVATIALLIGTIMLIAVFQEMYSLRFMIIPAFQVVIIVAFAKIGARKHLKNHYLNLGERQGNY